MINIKSEFKYKIRLHPLSVSGAEFSLFPHLAEPNELNNEAAQ